jgi:hypothetical protein
MLHQVLYLSIIYGSNRRLTLRPGMLLHAEGYSLVLGTVKTGSEGLHVLQTWAADPSPEVNFLGASGRRFALLRHAPSLCA